MAFCANCGTQAQDGVKFCPSCGNNMEAPPAQTPPPAGGYTPPPAGAYPPPPGGYAPQSEAQQHKTMGILSYLFVIIPLIQGDYKKSEWLKYHVNQGTVLWLAALANNLILNWILALIPFIGPLVSWGISVVIIVFAIMGAVAASKGEMKPLPLIDKIKIIK